MVQIWYLVGDGGTWYLFQGWENCSKFIHPKVIFKVWKIYDPNFLSLTASL